MTERTNSKICVVIGRTRHKMVLIEIQEAAKRAAQMIELRLDFLAKAPDFKRLLQDKPCEMLATVRRVADGGRWTGTEEARQMLLRQAIVAGFDWIDLETDIADQIRRFGQVKRIVSYHNFRGVPENLEQIHETMCKQDPDVVKIAVTAHSPQDNFRILELIRNSKTPTVAFCMGDIGLPSRIMGARFGQPFTYAAFNKERGIAPGLPSLDEVRKLYRYEQIERDTPIFGVIGDPVAHSLSPLIHNKTLKHTGLPGVYLPFRIPRGQLESFLTDSAALPIKGFSVTIPHKEAALKVANKVDPEASLIGAANTLVLGEHGWEAHNTDGQAALDSIITHLPQREDGSTLKLKDMQVLILGAGGVARAIAYKLHMAGAGVTITNRTSERAAKLAHDVGCRTVDWTARHTVLSDLLINCTSVGMQPNVDECPIHASYLKPGLMVFDTIYTPETTLLIKQARERECHVLTGVDMFVRQAGLQFQLFTGHEGSMEKMDQLVRRALSPITIRDED